MRVKTLLILSSALIILAIITFLTSQPKKKVEETLIPEEFKVNYLKIVNDNSSIELERKNDTWFINQPIKTKADGMEVDTILFRLQKLSKVRKLGKPKDLAEYGLKKKRSYVVFRGTNGSGEIIFGDKNPMGSHIYALKDGKLYLVERSIEDIFKKSLNDLREKRIFWGNIRDVDGVSIFYKRKNVKAEKKGNEWKVEGNLCKNYKSEKIEYIVDDFGFLRFEKIIDGELKGKGSLMRIIFKSKGKKVMDLRICNKNKEGYYPTFENVNKLKGLLDDSRFNILKEDIEKLCREEKNGSKENKGQKGNRKKP